MEAQHVRALTKWFAANARDLPWRAAIGTQRDPYGVLVSEAMLQQTQVSRVVERFPKFMERFPTVQALAAADEQDVLAMWAGMGYYRRAKNLHLAAKMIVERFSAEVPRDVASLLELPGVGRYTAGAIASIAFGESAPIVDGNVARVLLRVHGREARSDDRASQKWLWERAEELASAGARLHGAGVANEAIMELGATVCVPPPTTPRCGQCPLSRACVARREDTQGRIPIPKAPAVKRTVHCASVVVRSSPDRVLLEQRGEKGMWAGLWQVPTIEHDDLRPTRAELARAVGLKAAQLEPCGGFTHVTTHREVRFEVFAADWEGRGMPVRGGWVAEEELHTRGISNAQKRVLQIARHAAGPTRSVRRASVSSGAAAAATSVRAVRSAGRGTP